MKSRLKVLSAVRFCSLETSIVFGGLKPLLLGMGLEVKRQLRMDEPVVSMAVCTRHD